MRGATIKMQIEPFIDLMFLFEVQRIPQKYLLLKEVSEAQ
jgi:hypothetical protein